jgi:hypothetical protein
MDHQDWPLEAKESCYNWTKANKKRYNANLSSGPGRECHTVFDKLANQPSAISSQNGQSALAGVS